MFDHTSRYDPIETATFVAADGREIVYKRRRFLPQGEKLPVLAEVTVNQGDRLDLITAMNLNESEQFWRIADANNALDPLELVATPGRVLIIPIPQL
jgi:hypothetical protein